MAAAIGAGLPVHEATGNMVVDVGGGTTEVAVISLGGIVTSLSIRTAGDDLDHAIIAWMKKEYSLMLRERTRRGDQDDPRVGVPAAAGARGRGPRPDMISGLPKTVVVSSAEVRMAIEEPLHAIVDAGGATTLDQPRPSSPATSWTVGWCSPAAARCCAGPTSGCGTRPGWPEHIAESRSARWPWARGKCVEEFEALQQVPRLGAPAVRARCDRPLPASVPPGRPPCCCCSPPSR